MDALHYELKQTVEAEAGDGYDGYDGYGLLYNQKCTEEMLFDGVRKMRR